jgi:hypothetical protein
MTFVVDILAKAARQCSVPVPSSWLTATDQTALEVIDFMGDTVADVMDRLDLASPIGKTVTLTGTGAETLALPDDFRRVQRSRYSVYEPTRTRRDCVPVQDDGEWEHLKSIGSAGGDRFYMIRGYSGAWTIDFFQPLEAGSEVRLSYISENWIVGDKAEFSDTADISMIPRLVVETGIVWRYRKRKGLDYADTMQEHEARLARYGNDTRGRRVVGFGASSYRSFRDIPVPDVIPGF